MKLIIAAALATTLLVGGSHGQNTFGIYDGCFTEKDCFVSPEGCFDDQNCDFVATWFSLLPDGDSDGADFIFEMQASNDLTDPSSGAMFDFYIAMGFSTDAQMGEDTVFMLLTDQDVPGQADTADSLYHNVNNDRGPVKVRTPLFVAESGDVPGFTKLSEGFDRDLDIVYGRYSRPASITYENPLTGEMVTNGLLEQPFYLMVATGRVEKDENGGETPLVPQYHGENKVVSDAPIIFFG